MVKFYSFSTGWLSVSAFSWLLCSLRAGDLADTNQAHAMFPSCRFTADGTPDDFENGAAQIVKLVNSGAVKSNIFAKTAIRFVQSLPEARPLKEAVVSFEIKNYRYSLISIYSTIMQIR